MQIKKILCILLCLAMLAGMMVGCGNQESTNTEVSTAAEQSTPVTIAEEDIPDTTPDADELRRAKLLGLVSNLESADTVSFREYFSMLDILAVKIDADAAKEFSEKYPDARESSEAMTRYDSMVAIYALAESLGGEYLNIENSWISLHEQIGEKAWDEIIWSSLYGTPGWEVQSQLMSFTMDAAAYFYALGRFSLYSESRLFEYDAEHNTMRCADGISRYEAILSVVRFYDSSWSAFPVTQRDETEADTAYLSSVRTRIEEIRASGTTVSCTGTAYYVSNEGSDDNDGLTPETAWASVLPVNCAELKEGDAVFFRRGDIFRGILYCRGGVTYSAYGNGDKPRIYASPESGADVDKWSLWYDEAGVKIWKYHRTLQDCGGIVFNDGESWASRVYSYWNGEKAVSVTDFATDFDMISELEYDLQFYCSYPQDIASNELPFAAFDAELHGELYLRCDEGNPADIYTSIEFQCPEEPMGYCGIIQCCEDNITIDNLCIMYSNTMAITSGSNNNIIVQNCEAAFVGGGSHIIGSPENIVPVSGEGIRLDGYNNRAVNNYVHDCFDGGIILEPDLSFELNDGEIPDELLNKKWGEIAISGNVIERCNSGILVGVHCEDDIIPFVESVTITDNDILYCGYGWSGGEHYNYTWGSADYDGNAITFWDDDYSHGDFLVENNRLYVAKASLVHYGYSDENMPVFNGNSYTQNTNGHIVRGSDFAIANSNAKALSACTELLQDSNATILN